VRSLVHLHGGTVTAHSEGAGLGSQFIVTLPQHTLNLSSPNQKTTPGHDAPQLSPRTILIADDNIDAAESLGEFLKASGHSVHVTHDGASAISNAARIRPEVVILDIGMPAMDGYQVAQCLRTEVGLTSSMLIAVTGYAQERDCVSAHNAGFDHHFAKPLDIGKLSSLLNNAN
jgi:CheY-like chemotaxis protein